MDELKESLTDVVDIYSRSIELLAHTSIDTQLYGIIYYAVDCVKILQRKVKQDCVELFGDAATVDIRHTSPVTTSFNETVVIALVTHAMARVAATCTQWIDHRYITATIPLISIPGSRYSSLIFTYMRHIPISMGNS